MANCNTVKKISQYTKLKVDGIRVAEMLDQLGHDRRASTIRHCGHYVVTSTCDCSSTLTRAWFCRERWCPMCQKMRSNRFVADTMKILHQLCEIEHEPKFIFITLTMKNVTAAELPTAIDQILYGFKKLVLNKVFTANVKGFIRSLEVTYNKERNDYHPHVHALLYVKHNYFNYHSQDYITHQRLLDTWKSMLGVDYDPWVDIRRVRNKETGEPDPKSAVPEVLKYAVKPSDMLISPEVLQTLMTALRRRNLIGYGGILKKIKRLLKIKDLEDKTADLAEPLPTTDCACKLCKGIIVEELYRWNVGKMCYQIDNEDKPPPPKSRGRPRTRNTH